VTSGKVKKKELPYLKSTRKEFVASGENHIKLPSFLARIKAKLRGEITQEAK
jgi:hypothetical protein